MCLFVFFFQAEDGIRDIGVTGVQTCALPIFAATPLILALLTLWPVRLALYGGDMFREGGDDDGTVGRLLDWVEWALLAWCIALLAVGVRALYDLPWRRVPAVLGLAALTLVGLVALFAVLG